MSLFCYALDWVHSSFHFEEEEKLVAFLLLCNRRIFIIHVLWIFHVLPWTGLPPTMTTMQGTQWNEHHPIASLDSYHAPIEFAIPPHTEFYTDLSQAYLYIKFRILQQTGEDHETDIKVFPN